eukprot:TRINITY_DN10395_c0_g1_i1.p1 TRINITY_DN10395_c0_g1~~TRINITY_DN10395_c0_g1_i1.p1  ORF type:complete len:261 (+),score=30.10 TRINITY_DN10395_c0_g1_i1:455-1237(+)
MTFSSEDAFIQEEVEMCRDLLPGAPIAVRILQGKTVYFCDVFDGPLSLIEAEYAEGNDNALRIFGQMSHQVHALHTRKIVHRDIKVPNTMVDISTGRVVLTDFQSCALAGWPCTPFGVTADAAPLCSPADTSSYEYDYGSLARTFAAIVGVNVGPSPSAASFSDIESNCSLFPQGQLMKKVIVSMFLFSAKKFPQDAPVNHESLDQFSSFAELLEALAGLGYTQQIELRRILDLTFLSCHILMPWSTRRFPERDQDLPSL